MCIVGVIIFAFLYAMPRPSNAPRNQNFMRNSRMLHTPTENDPTEYEILGVYNHNLYEDADGDLVSDIFFFNVNSFN